MWAKLTELPRFVSQILRRVARTPLTAHGLSKSYGSLEIFAAVDLAIDQRLKGSNYWSQRSGKDDSTSHPGRESIRRTPGLVEAGHGLKIGYYAQEHETLDVANKSVLENMQSAAPHLGDVDARKVLGSFLFSGDDVAKKAGVLSGGERKLRLALASLVVSSANVLLLDEPTNNLDPASRKEILSALASFTGAVVLVSHDEGAVLALNPERVSDPSRRHRGPLVRSVRGFDIS
jgi:ATPase subunit of ABC transporter with duplicated ATPase domains